MEQVDIAYEKLKEIKNEFATFCQEFGKVSESDTRAKLIDRILKEVCYWPEANVQRESHSDSGRLDYSLTVHGKKFVVVEAKKEGETFVFPKDRKHKFLKISGAFTTNQLIAEAILQARGYCDDNGIRYAIVTNGYSWIIFRALREDMPWKEGSARIFYSLESVEKNFVEFWNLLNYDRICNGSLDEEMGTRSSPKRELYRVVNYVLSPDQPLLRNSLNQQLHPIITNFFEDITNPSHLETLKNCYVYLESLNRTTNDMNYVIKDAIPKFLQDGNTTDVKQGKEDAGNFGHSMERAMQKDNGSLFLLLGGIGSGKTTFQKRYQLTVGKETLDNNTIWFSIDFLKPPSDPADLEPFVWQKILDQLRSRYPTPYFETRQTIKRVFKNEIEALKPTALYGLREGSTEYETALTPYLTKWQTDLKMYVPRLLSISKPKKNLCVVLFFDNVDQLSPHYQSQIFILAQKVTDDVGSLTIIALREESYYTASVQKVFTAYINRKFHIASPPFRRMIDQRIKYALNVMEQTEAAPLLFEDLKAPTEKDKIVDFLKIVEFSIFESSKNIARFIDHLCFGNMRLALQMFSTFLVSGATDVDKILRIYRRDGSYFVPFHEFLRSIMLGDRYYYKEIYSVIMNVFECGQERNSSHFTALRILNLLNSYKSESNKEGVGFVEIAKILFLFEDIFNNKEDFIKTLNRLVSKQLVEANTKSTENINDASHVRMTSAGWYYLKFLISNFSYLDLVFQDTPLNSEALSKELVNSVGAVNNLADPEEDKIPRLKERFRRVELFIDYLSHEEYKERELYNLAEVDNPVASEIMPNMWTSFIDERDWIMKRIAENRERFAEERIQQSIILYEAEEPPLSEV